MTEQAVAQLLERATSQPAQGYRFMGFMPHNQVSEPRAGRAGSRRVAHATRRMHATRRRAPTSCSASPRGRKYHALWLTSPAPCVQDFDPSANHLANYNRALQEMVVQSGEDGFASTTIALLPAWPCEWDLDFKLHAPLNTTVEGSVSGGKLVGLVVTPPERASAVRVVNCAS